MKVYLVVQFNITNPEEFKIYAEQVPKILEAYGGKYLARGGETVIVEGKPLGNRSAIVEFPSREAAEAWYNSPEYQGIIHHRKNSTSEERFLIMLDEYTPTN